MGGCVSHDFLPLINGRYKDNARIVTIAVWLRCDELRYKYFREGGALKDIDTDFEVHDHWPLALKLDSSLKESLRGT